jgi:hypothetical protein
MHMLQHIIEARERGINMPIIFLINANNSAISARLDYGDHYGDNGDYGVRFSRGYGEEKKSAVFFSRFFFLSGKNRVREACFTVNSMAILRQLRSELIIIL